MGLLDRPGQPQRYGLLSPDVMNLIASGGPRMAPAPAAPAQPARRGPGFLTYLMEGREGMERERMRPQMEAARAQMEAARQQYLSGVQDPRERALFLGAGSEDWNKNVGEQYAPQVIAAGGVQSVIGNGARVSAPRDMEFGDSLVRTDPLQPAPQTLMQRGPTIKEGIDQQVADTGRINATNVPVSPNTDLVDPTTGRAIYQGFRPPNVTTVAPGGEALITDASGNVTNRVASSQARPMSDADQSAVARADNQITSLDTSLTRAAEIERQISRGELNLGVVENIGAGVLNMGGMSNQNSLNYDALMAWAKEASNAILQANTGVQTDQDAIRELDTILSSSRDERLVSAALRRFQVARTATRGALQRDIDRRSAGPAPSSGGQGQRLTPQQAQALPPGTRFIGTDGVERVRQ